jgi:hypothetical protein
MKDDTNSNPEAFRTLWRVKEETAPEVRYYNDVVVAADILFARAEAGDLEFLGRLRMLAEIAVEVAGRAESSPCPSDTQDGNIKKVPFRCPPRGIPF